MAILPRFVRLFLLVLILLTVPSLYLLYTPPSRPHSPSPHSFGDYEAGGIDSDHFREPVRKPKLEQEEVREELDDVFKEQQVGASPAWMGFTAEEDVLGGGVIMGKMENATAKAELGRAAWRVLHLMTLRFPDEPTQDDRSALKSFFHLFSRLYPCGDCAKEFQALLKEYPPQTSSRKAASLWLCHVHNQVNERLGKPEFDCLTLDSTYDCGCGDEDSASNSTSAIPPLASAVTGAKVGTWAGTGLDSAELAGINTDSLTAALADEAAQEKVDDKARLSKEKWPSAAAAKSPPGPQSESSSSSAFPEPSRPAWPASPNRLAHEIENSQKVKLPAGIEPAPNVNSKNKNKNKNQGGSAKGEAPAVIIPAGVGKGGKAAAAGAGVGVGVGGAAVKSPAEIMLESAAVEDAELEFPPGLAAGDGTEDTGPPGIFRLGSWDAGDEY